MAEVERELWRAVPGYSVAFFAARDSDDVPIAQAMTRGDGIVGSQELAVHSDSVPRLPVADITESGELLIKDDHVELKMISG